MNCRTPGFPVLYHLLEFAQTHVHLAIQPSHPLLPPFPPALNLSHNCNQEIKRHLLLGRKAMTNLDIILKSRDITLLTKVRLVKVMVFPVVMYGCESWTMKKADHWRIDAFELWCWEGSWELLESKEIKAINPKGNQLWTFIGKTDAKAPII